MDALQPAGWYPDPSGMPDTFRWWDGLRWTQALSPRADAPPPPNPKPVVSEEPTTTAGPPLSEGGQPETRESPGPDEQSADTVRAGKDETTAPAESGESAGGDPGVVPPPDGAPGPEYLPARTESTEQQTTQQPASTPDDDEPDRQNLRSVLVVVIVLAVLAAVGVGAWWFWRPQGETETATPPPHQVPSTSPSAPSPSPTPTPDSPSPSPTEDAQPSESARLAFEPLGGKWKESPRLGLLSDGYAEAQVTQSDFDGRNDWIALVTAGTTPPSARQGSLDEQARAVAVWFQKTGFDPMKVDVDTVDNKSVEVDGRPAHLVVQRLHYDNPALQSRSDLVTVVVVDMGEGNPSGVFLASVPNTDEKLTVDVDNARRSLHIAE